MASIAMSTIAACAHTQPAAIQSTPADVPWYERTYRFAQTNFTEDDPVKADIEFWRSQWRRTHTQGVIINAGGIIRYYPSKYTTQHAATHLGEQDFFKKVNDAAREEGLEVIARMDINMYDEELYKIHPEWSAIGKDGKPLMVACINSGFYTEHIPAILTEIIELYHPSGFADNNWKGTNRNVICYCDECRARFKAERGMDLPEAVDWEDPAYREWVRWGYERRVAIWDLFNETVKRVGDDDCRWFGMIPAEPYGPAFVDHKAVLSRSDMVFTDQQSRGGGGFEQNSINGTFLRLASDENAVVIESMANYVGRGSTFRLASNPPLETRTWMIEGIAGGIDPWWHHIGGSQNDRRQFETPVPVFQWHKANEQYLHHRFDLADVGVVWSQENADYYGRGEANERAVLPYRGFTQALVRHRIPFLPINVHDIARYTPRLKTLVLPNIAILPDEAIDAVCRFVEQGGNLVVTGATATLDYDGAPSTNHKLWKMLGLSFTGETKGVFGRRSADWGSSTAHNYYRLPKEGERHEIFAGFENTDMLPFGGGIYMVASSGVMQPQGSFIPSFPIYPPEYAWIRTEEPDTHPIWTGTMPSGARVVYFAGDNDRAYGRNLLPDHAQLLTNAIRWASDNDFPLEVEGTGHLDCKVYRQDDRLIIHIVNITGKNRIGYVEENLPVGPIKVSVKADGISARKATLRVSGKTVPVKHQGDRLSFTVDKVEDFEMAVIGKL
jgi:hypothetical protein